MSLGTETRGCPLPEGPGLFDRVFALNEAENAIRRWQLVQRTRLLRDRLIGRRQLASLSDSIAGEIAHQPWLSDNAIVLEGSTISGLKLEFSQLAGSDSLRLGLL